MNPNLDGRSLAHVHKQLGLSVFQEKNYGRAFAHYSLALSLEPTLKTELEEVYFASLYAWCEQLESEGKLKELFLCYEQAFTSYSDSVDVHFSLANQLNRLGHTKEAAKFYKKALQIDQNHVPSYHNLLSIYTKLVERWHYRMLNDKVRNDAYKQAIAKKITKGYTEVLDIGTGTGLLSLFAVKNGAKQVYACDHSPVMVEIASEVFKKSGCSERIKLIEKTSSALTIPNDIPDRVPLVVTEIMDAGVFGESLLQTLIHAWDQLLVSNSTKNERNSSPPGSCIPQAVTIYAVPIQSAFLSKKYRYPKSDPEPSSFSLPNFVANLSEPYDAEDLRRLANNVCYLSKPVEIITTDFNNPEELSQLYETKVPKLKTVKITCCGRIDAIACFFKVNLDADIAISTSPIETEDIANCWEQSVFPCLEPVYVTLDEEINLSVRCFEGKLSVRVVDERQERTASNFLSQDNIRFLNDSELMRTLKETASKLCNISGSSQISILDLSSLPVLGLLLVSELQKSKNAQPDLMYYKEDESVENFVELFKERNAMKPADLKSFCEEDLYSFFLDHEETYDFIIMNNLVSSDGSLNERMFFLLPLIRKNLKSGGKILPEKLSCMGQFINCDWLSKVSSVVPESRNNIFGIAPIINQFQVPLHYGLNLETLEYSELSNEFQLFSIDINMMTEETIQTDITVNVLRTGLLSGTAIWFIVQFLKDNTSCFASMKSSDSSVDQMASLMSPPINITENASIIVSALFEKGLLKINVDS